MPVYAQSVGSNSLSQVAVSGTPAYLYGSLAADTQDTLMQVTNVALTSNVVTLNVTMRQGSIPVVGNLATVQGTATSSGVLNVKAVPLTGVTIAANGTGTITYALTNANIASVADAGQVYIPVQEVGESVAANQSVAIYVPSQEAADNGLRNITVSTTFPTLQASTGAVTVTLYTAMKNDPIPPGTAGSEWTSVGVVGTAAAGAQTVGPLKSFTTPAGRFFCLVNSGVTGTNTIVSKLLS
jgi:hypothetical protein